MMSVVNDSVNQKLKHFQVALGLSNESHLEWAIQKLGNLNNQIAATNCLKLCHPELIGSTELHFAFLRNNLKAFRMLLSCGADFTLKNQEDLTTLHLALKSITEKLFPPPDWIGRLGSPFITAVLMAHVEHRQSTNPCDPNGLSHFHIACITNNDAAVKFFLENGVSLNDQVKANSSFAGYTPLHFAVRHFNFQVVKILLKHGASINLRDAEGLTPMQVLLKRNFEMIKMNSDLQSAFQQERNLSEKIAKLFFVNVNKKGGMIIDDMGFTCLHVASALMDLLEVEKLFEKVIDVNHCVNVESPFCAGYNALHFAAFFNINIVKSLVKRGADLQAKDAKGVTPLDLCLERYKVEDIHSILSQKEEWKGITFSDGKTKLFDLLSAMRRCDQLKNFLRRVTKNAVITLPNNSPLWPGFSPMHVVVLLAKSKANHYDCRRKLVNQTFLDMVSALFKKNSKMIECQDNQGRTPLHLCFRLGKMENIVELFLTLHETLDNPVDLVDEDNLSLLHIACAHGNEELVKKLLSISNKVNLAYSGETIEKSVLTGWTPLDVAANDRRRYGGGQRSGIEKRLIKCGAYANASHDDEVTETSLGNITIITQLTLKVQTKEVSRKKWSKLHDACAKRDTNLVEHLLDTGANVNAKISTNSASRPGYTPLHLALVRDYQRTDTNHLLRLLLDRRADVTVPNVKQRTPIHMAFQHYISQIYYFGLCEPTFKDLSMLLRAHKDFKVNPTSIEGITHFHIACALADFVTVEKFLKYGNVDVNQPIDFFFDNSHSFKHFPGAGCTPLHLAVLRKNDYDEKKKFVDITSQLETVDLLLKHRANVDAENSLGETPFHVAICFELRERLVRGGANVEAKDACGYTLLQNWLSKRPKSPDTIKELLRCGCRYNALDPHTGIGCLGLTMRSLSLKNMQKLVSTATINFPDAMDVDEFGRTMIHNLVSIYQINVSDADYATLIEQMIRTGCSVDDQDPMGRTALHVAVTFKNLRAISGLLLAGADINIRDVNGQTPFAYQFQPCTRCDQPTDAEDEQCVHYRIFKLFALQVIKLRNCGLDVHPRNEEIRATAFPSFGRVVASDQFTREREDLKNVRIRSYRLNLHDFMSEINAVADYPTMSEDKRNAISEFFLPNEEYRQFREKYSEVAGLLRLQYRKAAERGELIQKAKRSLDLLAGIRVPEVCSRIILRFLTNSELQKAIASSDSK